MKYTVIIFILMGLLNAQRCNSQSEILIEAESFSNLGGWKVDQQFTHLMGSSYVLAHGLGEPVANAAKSFKVAESNEYTIWVRTKDWVPEHPECPGQFKILINGNALPMIFGKNEGWNWVNGGKCSLNKGNNLIELKDLTGFDGRCDAIFLTTHSFTPPNELTELNQWRRQLLGIAEPTHTGDYDVVIIGGGMAGCSAAIAAAREGCSVVLIQDRPVLGGNASEEIRVHTIGLPGHKIVHEINTDHYPNGSQLAIESNTSRHSVILEEENIDLFLNTRAFAVNKHDRNIVSIDAKDIRTGEEYRFNGTTFIDCTGDGWIGYWAGNRFMIGREAKSKYNESLAPEIEDNMMMGSTLLFNSHYSDNPSAFPEVAWAMDVAKDYAASKNEWYWEYGIGSDPFADAEKIRDHLLRAIYGAFFNEKQKDGNEYLKLKWVGYVSGKRESRRLLGEHILTQNDVINSVEYDDNIVFEEREIDLHMPKSDIYDFLTKAIFTKIDLYYIPFRCFIAADLDNLMMAGRCFSCSHVGLGSPRVMNTIGQMGVATGSAAALCKKYDTDIRDVCHNHMNELKILVGLDPLKPDNGIILDNLDSNGSYTGEWQSSTFNSKYYGSDYWHDKNENKGQKSFVFSYKPEQSGSYVIYERHTSGGSRSSNTPVTISSDEGLKEYTINQRINDGQWIKLDTLSFSSGTDYNITVRNDNTDGHVIVDAFSLVHLTNTDIPSVKTKQTNIKVSKIESNKVTFAVSLVGADNILEIYNLNGQLISKVNLPYSPGNHKIVWQYYGTSISDKLFIAQITNKQQSASCKFLIKD
ncbi:MAG: FAD-dependent oxidoreductase [Carboxylicivirga sp.]|jgi:hypothetical protein|nr:FAD-dependent oxidoreductase [Carboxylicivirga sp.]